MEDKQHNNAPKENRMKKIKKTQAKCPILGPFWLK